MKWLPVIVLLISNPSHAFIKATDAARLAKKNLAAIQLKTLEDDKIHYGLVVKQIEVELLKAIKAGQTGAFVVPKYFLSWSMRQKLWGKLQDCGYRVEYSSDNWSIYW